MAPWTLLWDRNYFGDLWPWLDALMENMYARGAVSGVGLITAWVGLRDLIAAVMGRRAAAQSATPGHDADARQ